MRLYNNNTGSVEVVKTISTPTGTMVASSATDAQLNAYGYFKIEYQTVPNTRYYSYVEKRVLDGTVYKISYDHTELPVEVVKQKMLMDIKAKQAKMLAEIDWYWLREMKTGTPVPSDIQDKAAYIYSEAASREAEVNTLASIDAVIEFERKFVETITDEEGQSSDVYENRTLDW